MLLYLPERIYKHLEQNQEYTSLCENVRKNVFGDKEIDFLKIMSAYENENEEIKQLQQYIRDNVPSEFQTELDLSFTDDLKKYEAQFENMDVETKLYWLCEMEAGDMTLTKEFSIRNMKFLRIYKNYVLPNKKDYSAFLHCMYYSKLIYKIIIDMTTEEKTYDLVMRFFKAENEAFNEIINYSDLKAFKQMMFSKREQMYVLFYEFIGQFCLENKEVNEFIRKCIKNNEFKYNEFTYFKLMFYHIAFQQYIDNFQIEDAKKYLDYIIKLINFAYCNKQYAVKSLNHYNNAFIDEFLNYSHFMYKVISKYMPNLNNKWNFINDNMTDLEKRYYLNKLSAEEYKIYSKYNKNDNNYTLGWVESSKNVLKELDSLYA